MYSIVLMMALSSAQETPQGILFNRGGGCGGQASVQSGGCGGESARLFNGRLRGRLFHRRSAVGGCGGGAAAVEVQSTYQYRSSPVIQAPAEYKKMPVGEPAPVPSYQKPPLKSSMRMYEPPLKIVPKEGWAAWNGKRFVE